MDDRIIMAEADLDAALAAQTAARRNALLRKANMWRRHWLLIAAAPLFILASGVAAAITGDDHAARTIYFLAIITVAFGIVSLGSIQSVARRQLKAEFPGDLADDA